MREAVNGFRSKILGGVLPTKYAVGRVMSGLRHSRDKDPNTRQVNVTRSPGHVNCLSLFEVSSTFSTKRKMTERRKLGGICTSVHGDDTQKHQKYVNKPLETKLTHSTTKYDGTQDFQIPVCYINDDWNVTCYM